MKEETRINTDRDAEVERQTAVALPSREVMSIIDLSLGPKIFPQTGSQNPVPPADGIDDPDPSQS